MKTLTLISLFITALLFGSCEHEGSDLNELTALNAPASEDNPDGELNGCNFVTLKNNPIDEFDPRDQSVDFYNPINTEDERWQEEIDDGNLPGVEMIKTYQPNNSNVYLSSTWRFNCYGLAWFMADHNDLFTNQDPESFRDMDCSVFIGGVEDSHQLIQDQSYRQVEVGEAGWIHPAIIHGGSHALITTPEKGIAISKWGETGPLMKHPVDVGLFAFSLEDYKQEGYEFYVRHDFCNTNYPPKDYQIIGPTSFTCTGTYSIPNLLEHDVVEWIYDTNVLWSDPAQVTSNSITLSPKSGGSVTTTVQIGAIIHYHKDLHPSICAPSSRSLNPINVQLQADAAPVVSYSNFAFGNAFGYPASYLCNSHSGNYYLVNNELNATRFDVEITHLNRQVIYSYTTNSRMRNVNYPTLEGYYLFRIKAWRGCREGPWYEVQFENRDCSLGGGGDGSGEEDGFGEW